MRLGLGDRRDLRSLPEGVRFIIAGGFASLINWLVRFPLSVFMPFPAAVAVATTIGMLVGFFAYRHFVFPKSERAVIAQVRDFIMVNLGGIAIVVAVSTLFADAVLPALGIIAQADALAHAIGIAAGAVSNYFGHRTISFRRATPGAPRDGASL